ncbi:hypothetical protein BDV96DRAFT_601098 [Lophiotrema nucula]|uniref:Uncharacterized protein n=1 Tax=Lophiotrema nucula TaxID=690887 RepID=A0A6A5Z2I1_9PLEO|nr:hypothetical protein BDV96DRAFT_601098 [Lophiotrema nucula]
MGSFLRTVVLALASITFVISRDANITLVPASTSFESDNTAFYYSPSSQLLVNDGSAADGGFRIFDAQNSPATEKGHLKTGRSKVATPVYDIGGKDVFVTIAAPDSTMRVFDARTATEFKGVSKKVLGDWSTLCVWRYLDSGESYLFMFGKKKVVQLLVRKYKGDIEIQEVQTFPIPIEGETCAVARNGLVYFSAEDQPLYSFQASESTKAPSIATKSEDIEVAGLAVYHSASDDYLFVAHDDQIDVYDDDLKQKGTIALSDQHSRFPSGAIALAFEGANSSGVATGSLEDVLSPLGIESNLKYSPEGWSYNNHSNTISRDCSYTGFFNGGSCDCFAGFTGQDCSKITCRNECSGHGSCMGANVCKCEDGWEGPDCSFVAVKAKYETDANGGDGDDPAIWIHPTDAGQSKIITTTKSEEGAGFAVFDLEGNLIQHQNAEEPNNVDVIQGFVAGNRSIDLIFAACRGDNTICLFEINSTGLLTPIAGGVQPTLQDYEVYGSCTYTSLKTNKTFLFVNNKDAEYLQYKLSYTNSSLQTTLVRNFTGGSGGQVEGCVADDAAGFLFLGEESEGIWRYDAEPDGSPTGFQIAKAGDGKLAADVEGITLVTAEAGPDGYLMVSSQGESKYVVYERAPPHAYVLTFTIVDNDEDGIDHVSNTDGITAVANALNSDFPGGLFATHDDANELPDGGTAEQASFKLLSLFNAWSSVQAVEAFGIAKSFPPGETSTFEAIARACSLSESDVRRILRHAMAQYIFREPSPGAVEHTAASKALAEIPALASCVGFLANEMWPASTRLSDALRKWPGSEEPNETGFAIAYDSGLPMFDFVGRDPARAKRMAGAMSFMHSGPGYLMRHVIDHFNWGDATQGLLVDVGGGQGTIAAEIARALPNIRCIVQDLPNVVEEAKVPDDLRERERLSFMAHDFFVEQPVKGADIYYLRWILHDWSEKYAIKILQNLIPALKPGARVLVSELCLPPSTGLSPYKQRSARTFDLGMKAIQNAKERDAEDWAHLFQAADPRFKLHEIIKPPEATLSIICASWAGESAV